MPTRGKSCSKEMPANATGSFKGCSAQEPAEKAKWTRWMPSLWARDTKIAWFSTISGKGPGPDSTEVNSGPGKGRPSSSITVHLMAIWGSAGTGDDVQLDSSNRFPRSQNSLKGPECHRNPIAELVADPFRIFCLPLTAGSSHVAAMGAKKKTTCAKPGEWLNQVAGKGFTPTFQSDVCKDAAWTQMLF